MLTRVYLDHNAGSPLRPGARARLLELLDGRLGNPSSLHAEGRRARDLLEEAREDLAALLGCERDELVFTSGGTESNALALRQCEAGSGLAVAATEHPSILAGVRARPDGLLLPVTATGSLDMELELPQASLFSVSLANHETGCLQDIAALSRRAHARGARLHSDLCQAVGRLRVELAELDVDLASVSAHKLGGLPGIGALVARRGLNLRPLWSGGGQEAGQRPGTEAAVLASVFAAAASEALSSLPEEEPRVREMTSYLRKEISHLDVEARVLTPIEASLPNTLSVAFADRRGAHLVLQLDRLGVAVSHGSACSSGSAEPSPVLLAMGLGENTARASIRISLGHDTTRAHVDEFLAQLRRVLRVSASQSS